MTKIAQLTDRKLISLSGADCISFLQNLVTANVENLSSSHMVFSGLLTPQGKVLFDFFILRAGDNVLIDTSQSQAADLTKRLTFYKLRADVAIVADERDVFVAWDGDFASGHSDPRHADLGKRIYSSCDANASQADWQTHRLTLGVPQSQDDFELGTMFPHDVLMDQTGGVDFEKGCYVGQEVVSRMQHRGTARTRAMCVSSVSGDDLPPIGTELSANGKKIGQMGGSAKGNGIAFVRLDRAATALQEGHSILAGEEPVLLTKPEFAQFEWAS